MVVAVFERVVWRRADFGMQAPELVSAANANVIRDSPRNATAKLVAGRRQLVDCAVLLEHQVVIPPRAVVEGKRTRLLCSDDAVHETSVFVLVLASVNTAEHIFIVPATLGRCSRDPH